VGTFSIISSGDPNEIPVQVEESGVLVLRCKQGFWRAKDGRCEACPSGHFCPVTPEIVEATASFPCPSRETNKSKSGVSSLEMCECDAGQTRASAPVREILRKDQQLYGVGIAALESQITMIEIIAIPATRRNSGVAVTIARGELVPGSYGEYTTVTLNTTKDFEDVAGSLLLKFVKITGSFRLGYVQVYDNNGPLLTFGLRDGGFLESSKDDVSMLVVDSAISMPPCQPCPQEYFKAAVGNQKCWNKCGAYMSTNVGAISKDDCYCNENFFFAREVREARC
jgi:hypothetical protein